MHERDSSSSNSSKHHYVFQTASGRIILEFHSSLVPPPAGTVIHLPALSNVEVLIPYRIQEIQFAPQSQEEVIIYIKVEPT